MQNSATDSVNLELHLGIKITVFWDEMLWMFGVFAENSDSSVFMAVSNTSHPIRQ
jgi:hypothetical protein